MHINAHLDVDLVAMEATDTVTVLLDLVAPPAPVDPASRAPSTPPSSCWTAPAPCRSSVAAAKRALLAWSPPRRQ